MRQLEAMDTRLAELRPQYPEAEALLDLYGVGLFLAMVIVSEFGDVCRFRAAKQAGAYTGLTPSMASRRSVLLRRWTMALRRNGWANSTTPTGDRS